MASLLEKLGNLYGGKQDKEPENNSWIPRKKRDSLKAMLEGAIDGGLTPVRREAMMVEQEELGEAKIEIFEMVAEYLLATYGERNLEQKLVHFQESWDKLFERYGTDMVHALYELTEEMKFVNHDGYIRKVVLRNGLEKLRKSRRDQ